MANQAIVIPKKMIGKKGMVILDLEEYKKFLKYEMEKEYIDKIVDEGLKEKKQGKTESLEKFLIELNLSSSIGKRFYF